MGKIKVATIGSIDEEALRDKQKVKREEKKKREKAEKIHIQGMKGGERVKSVGADSEEELDKLARLTEEVEKDQAEGIQVEKKKPTKEKKPRVRSRKYKEALMKLDPSKSYKIDAGIELLRQVSFAKFDATVELHINTSDKGLRGTLTLPHGTGKKIRVMIADNDTIDDLVKDVEAGKINFDALVAHPSIMGKLARVAKFLGPKGLMPNPKAGTITATPEKVADKLKAGEISWKTESDFPIIHQVIGKLSFKDNQLVENFKAFVKSVDEIKIKSITLKSTMSPGIKIEI